jgi:alkanesulfonate monooxygenase
LEEAYRVSELLFPHLPLEQDVTVSDTAAIISPFGEIVANNEFPKVLK